MTARRFFLPMLDEEFGSWSETIEAIRETFDPQEHENEQPVFVEVLPTDAPDPGEYYQVTGTGLEWWRPLLAARELAADKPGARVWCRVVVTVRVEVDGDDPSGGW